MVGLGRGVSAVRGKVVDDEDENWGSWGQDILCNGGDPHPGLRASDARCCLLLLTRHRTRVLLRLVVGSVGRTLAPRGGARSI